MNSYKKIFIIGLLFVSIGYTFAGSSDDCGLFSSDNQKASEQIINNLKYQNIFPVEAFNKSLSNLQSYCCKSVNPSNKYCIENKNNLSKYYPESAFLYDHLIDVGIRRLDAFDNLTYGLDPDIIGTQWRKRIMENAEGKDGITSKMIFDQYQKYRTSKNPIITIYSNGVINNKETFINNYNNIDQVSLVDKYISLCFVAKQIYENPLFKGSIGIGDGSDKNSYFSKCLIIIKNRINQENTYVQSFMIRKSNKLLIDVNKAYMNDSFVKKSLLNLQSKISEIKNLFKTVIKQSPTSQSCSK